MSRKPKSPAYDPGKDPQLYYISDKQEGTKDNFARVYHSMFYSKEFTRLNKTAQILYIAILLECRRQNHNSCVYPQSLYSALFSERSFLRSREELEKAGFIETVRNRTKPTVYMLSDKWKTGEARFNPEQYIVKISRKK